FALPIFIAVACLGLGCFFLVFELGQPQVFLRVFLTATSIIKWGAVLLSFALIFAFIYFLSCLPWAFFAFLVPLRPLCLVLAGISGTLVMVYTGVFLASLKPHAFWNTPALPVLFTVSALSTGSAATAATVGKWPVTFPELLIALNPLADAGATRTLGFEMLHHIQEQLHAIDMALIGLELVVLFIYVLLLRGSGNEVARAVAKRWLSGKFAAAFWVGMVFFGLLVPFLAYLAGGVAASFFAPIMVLAGGCLLRFLVVFSDDRRLVPGEKRFYDRLPRHGEAFLGAWKDKENLY
ncbi:MAG: polysulfide reductase NrfD, partial [Eggerthellaceae bacterium]|nr:polysulfide reductase NrfD [Eggerthellaceae bacterium]